MQFDSCRFGLVVQAALSDRVSFDPFAFEQDGLAAAEVDVGRGEIVEALVVSAIMVVDDEVRFLEGVLSLWVATVLCLALAVFII